MVWSIDAMNRAMAVTPKIRKRRGGAGSPGGTGSAEACAISLDVTVVYDTAYRQASILAPSLLLYWRGTSRDGGWRRARPRLPPVTIGETSQESSALGG